MKIIKGTEKLAEILNIKGNIKTKTIYTTKTGKRFVLQFAPNELSRTGVEFSDLELDVVSLKTGNVVARCIPETSKS